MSYKTELMEQILTSPQGQRVIQTVTPMYGESYAALWLYQIIGLQLDEIRRWTLEYQKQVVPQNATWTIAYWEKEYGITPEPYWTLEQRQKNIVNRMYHILPMNPARLASIASTAAGVPVEILEGLGQNSFDVLVRRNTDKFQRAKEEIEKFKPAHLIFTIHMAKLADAPLPVFGAVRACQYKKLNVEVKL